MSGPKEPTARNGEWAVKRAWINAESLFGLKLGDLRALIAKADGMPDNAEVTVEKLTKTSREGIYWVKNVMIEAEERT